jgi:phosphoadenosine phosphosulfate reductase
MLIPSERHRPEDLRLWREYEEADMACGRSKPLAKLAFYALASIRKFVSIGPCYAGVSWGKDSVVAADFVTRANRLGGLRIPLVWVRVEPICSPDCVVVRDEFLRSHDCDYHEVVVECSRDAEGWHASGTLETGFREAARIAGTRRYISGVRADESGARTISARSHGVTTATACRPLLHWKAADVFAWLAAKSLPVHPAYAMLSGGQLMRDRVRVASLGGRRGDGIGRAEWEREYYGDVLRRIEAKR